VDCHDNKTTDTTTANATTGYGWYDVTTTGCIMCHDDVTNGATAGTTGYTHERHRLTSSYLGGGIACASCHGEGGDDGHVWQFAQLGARRTQSLRGGVLARAPYHWDGAMRDFATLVEAVYVGRMGGPRLAPAQLDALARWVDAIPQLPAPPGDPAAAVRGAARFADPKLGCAGCHGGPLLSDLAIVDVGTGGSFKVPSLLGVGYRAPFLHSGCAPTLRDRFGPCGGGDQHGATAMLGPGELSDLTAYLETL
jgi:hypothetical protein